MAPHREKVVITDEGELREWFTALLSAAWAEGLEVERHWVCRTDGEIPDWDVDVVPLRDEQTSVE